MIPQDIIQRAVRAHDAAVAAARSHEASKFGSRDERKLWGACERAEKKFEAAMAALVDAARD